MKIVAAGFGVIFFLALVPPLLFGSGATASGQASSSGITHEPAGAW